MSQPYALTPPANHPGFDSLTADLVVADDRGGITVLPADPEVLARYLTECRRLYRNSAGKEKPKS